MTATAPAPPVEESGVEAPRRTMLSGFGAVTPFARPALPQFVIASVLAATSAIVSLVPFWAIYRCVTLVVDDDITQSDITRYASIALVAIVARFALFGFATYTSHLAAYKVLYEIRMEMADHLTVVPLGEVTKRRSGELKKVMGDDVERLELFLAHGIPDTISAIVTAVAVTVWLVVIDWRMAIATVIVLVPALWCMSAAMRKAGQHMEDYQRTLGQMNAAIVELVHGMPVVKTFNRDDEEVGAAQRAIDEHVSTVRKYSLDFLPLGTAFFVLIGANVVTIVPLGVWLNSRGSLSTADLLFFFIVGLGALGPVQSLLYLFSGLSHVTSGGAIVRDVLDTPALVEPDTPRSPTDRSVELRDVSFGYGDRDVLTDVSFRVEPGTVTALVGPSGAGKSTIAALVARFWDVRSGAVLVGGVNIRQIGADQLSRHVAVVLQDTFLFDDTIAANLRVASPDASQADLEAACRAAQIHDFIGTLPSGYDAVVGEQGARLSGGEKQRLAIARAILAGSPIVVLDEATAFADPENEAAIRDALGNLVGGRTVLMIAHRLSTVVDADQIVVVDGGQVVETGRHDELLARHGTYARLWHDFIAAEAISLGAAVHDGDAS